MAKWESFKGNYIGGVEKILEDYFKNAFGYPEVNLKLAGEEANLSRAGNLRAKEIVHEIVKAIKEASKPYRMGRGFKEAWVYFSQVPENAPPNSTALPPDVQQKLKEKIEELLAQLKTTNAYAQEQAMAQPMTL